MGFFSCMSGNAALLDSVIILLVSQLLKQDIQRLV
jgi:hypothetical protein